MQGLAHFKSPAAANDDGPAGAADIGSGRPARRRGSRLAVALDAHLTAAPSVTFHGASPRVEAMARIAGLSSLGVVVRRASVHGRGLTVVAVPARVWADRRRRAELLRLKRLGRPFGDRVLVVQEEPLLREPRLGNAVLVADCADAALTPADRFAVVGALLDEPGALLGDLAALVRGPTADPAGAVLSLVARGLVEVDTRRPIGPGTPAWLRPGRPSET